MPSTYKFRNIFADIIHDAFLCLFVIPGKQQPIRRRLFAETKLRPIGFCSKFIFYPPEYLTCNSFINMQCPCSENVDIRSALLHSLRLHKPVL